jgi:hypothetical protein
MSHSTLCDAIKSKCLVRFYYAGDDAPGYRTVEPHMVANTKEGRPALSAWYLQGASESDTQGWRIYLLSDISSVTVLEQTFSGPRPGYRPNGGKSFHSVRCAL